jgi:hypothetical protein
MVCGCFLKDLTIDELDFSFLYRSRLEWPIRVKYMDTNFAN